MKLLLAPLLVCLAAALDEPPARDWIVVGMRRDWSKIFPTDSRVEERGTP
jgi:hypothetical protein